MIDIQEVTEPVDPVFSHCHKPMRWAGVSMTWEGQLGSGWEISRARWDCTCGATLTAEIRVPS